MYNNYGNPYYQQPRFQQPYTQPTGLQGRQVENIDMVRVAEVPFDGSVSFFPLTDGSAIVTKQLQMDGTSKINIYKPIVEQQEEVKYITQQDLEKEMESIKTELNDLKQQFKEKGE